MVVGVPADDEGAAGPSEARACIIRPRVATVFVFEAARAAIFGVAG